MGNGLFDNYGVDIAGLVNEHLSPGLLPVTLKKWGAETGGARPTGQLTKSPARAADSTHYGRGIISDFDPSDFVDSQLLQAGDRKVMVILESFIPPAVPVAGDTVEIEGGVFRVARVIKRDPAGATSVLQVRDM